MPGWGGGGVGLGGRGKEGGCLLSETCSTDTVFSQFINAVLHGLY